MAISLSTRKPKLQSRLQQIHFSNTAHRSWRLWVGLSFMLISIIVTSQIISNASQRTNAIVLARDIAAGSTVSSTDFTIARVALPSSMSYVQDSAEVIGMSATRDLHAGEILLTGAVSNLKPQEMRTVSVPIRAGHLPPLQRGSLVDVWITPSGQGLSVPGPPTLVAAKAVIDYVPDGLDPNADTAISLLIANEKVPKFMETLRDGVVDLAVVPQSDGS